MTLRLLVCLALCAAAPVICFEAVAAGPPLPLPAVPNTAQERLQTQIMIQQAQAQARLAADQARAQARLDANQARLEGQVAAQEARAQAQLGVQQSIAASAPIVAPPLAAGETIEPLRSPAETMELITLSPRLGRYFGTDHGVLVARAPARGILKLQDGDVILSIGGRTPANSSQAMRILTSYDPGDDIKLVILRDHRRMSMTATMPAASPAGP